MEAFGNRLVSRRRCGPPFPCESAESAATRPLLYPCFTPGHNNWTLSLPPQHHRWPKDIISDDFAQARRRIHGLCLALWGSHAGPPVFIMMLPLASVSSGEGLCSTPLKWKAAKHVSYRTKSLTNSCIFYPTGISRSGCVLGPAISKRGLVNQCGVWAGLPLSSSNASAAVKEKGTKYHIFTSRRGVEHWKPA
jgi:hypothetical protein